MADISNGLAKVDLPWDLRCPISMTASSTGYQSTTQIFSTCTEEGGVNWTALNPGGTTSTTLPPTNNSEQTQLILTHSGDARIDTQTTLTVVANSAGVALASIQITPPDNNIQTTSTNAEGKVSLTLDKTGTWKISASKSGYTTGEHTFEVAKKPLTIELTPSSPKLKDSVEARLKSDGNNVEGVEAEIVYPDAAIIKRTSGSDGRLTFDAGKIGDYKVRVTATKYESAEQAFNIAGKAMEIRLNPTTPLCEQTTMINTFDSTTGYAIPNPKIRVDGILSGNSWKPTEGGHKITAEADEYNTATTELSIECGAVLTRQPTDVNEGQNMNATFSKETEWNVECVNSAGVNMTGMPSGRSVVVSVPMREAATCYLKWGQYSRMFNVKKSGWSLPSVEGNNMWYLVGALAIIALLVYGNKQGWFSGGSQAHFPIGKGWGGKGGGGGGPLVDREA